MGRALRLLGPVALGALLAGCGGSVADADTSSVLPTARAGSPGFCAAVQANSEAVRPLAGLTLNGPVNSAGDGLATAVNNARLSGDSLRTTAPGVIRADVQRVVDAMDLQLTALVAAGGDATRAARDPAVVAQFASAEVTAANQRVSAYVQLNCRAG